MADSITGAGAAQAALAASSGSTKVSGRAAIAENFEAFLLLLTTQLKNQSPLDPLDTNQFTQQLVQFASVEQQLKSNDTLNALLTSSRGSAASTAASFVGMEVTADGTTSRLSNGKAEWSINPARNALVSLVVKDAPGNIVAAQNVAMAAGPQRFSWNGITTTGSRAPDGDYTISIAARDPAGQSVSVKTEVAGKVDSVDLSGEAAVLVVGSSRVPLASVRSISRPLSQLTS
jgi:flagellar basal-body rod modification protein FlgD